MQPITDGTMAGPNQRNSSQTNPIQPFLDYNGVMILDGALATELERRGADLDHPLWSARLLSENPDLLSLVHYDYFVAGADVAISASYQATMQGFADLGIDRARAAQLLRASVELVIAARDQFWNVPEHRRGRVKPLVAASIGPYGAYLADGSEYRGDYGLSVAQLVDFHRERFALMVETPADLLAIETIPSLDEARALIQLVNEYQRWSWITFTCCDETHLCAGDRFRTAAEFALSSPWVVAAGINCTAPHLVAPLLHGVVRVDEKPFVVYPNRGDVWDAKKRVWRPSPERACFSDLAGDWYNAGARLIGGCCRTTPATIQVLADRFQ